MNFWVLIYRLGWITLAVLLVIAVISMFLPQVKQYQELRRREAVLVEDSRLEAEMLKHLQDQQKRLQTDPLFVEKIAREELGLSKPGETVFKFVDEEPPTNAKPR